MVWYMYSCMQSSGMLYCYLIFSLFWFPMKARYKVCQYVSSVSFINTLVHVERMAPRQTLMAAQYCVLMWMSFSVSLRLYLFYMLLLFWLYIFGHYFIIKVQISNILINFSTSTMFGPRFWLSLCLVNHIVALLERAIFKLLFENQLICFLQTLGLISGYITLQGWDR